MLRARVNYLLIDNISNFLQMEDLEVSHLPNEFLLDYFSL